MTIETLGRYEVVREIMRGGMAHVYLARDPIVDRQVAIKVLSPHLLQDPAFRVRFEHEEKLIAGLEHAAIVPIYDFGEHNGQPFIVMRYMPGGTLADRIAQGPLNGQELARILNRMAEALDEAHAQGIVHRDLKPRNVLFDAKGQAFLTDFGLAKVLAQSLTLTASGVVGTPAYMSPEQAKGERLDNRSDVYSLGLIVYESLTGRLPYAADTPMGIAVKHIVEPVPQIRQLDARFSAACEQVLARALAKNPADRYASAGELARAVTQLPELSAAEEQPSTGFGIEAAAEAQARAGTGNATPVVNTVPARRTAASRLRPGWAGSVSRRQMLAMGFVVVAGSILAASSGRLAPMFLAQPTEAAGAPATTLQPSAAATQVSRPTETSPPRPTPTAPSITATPAAGTQLIDGIDGAPMVFVPAGSFEMGSSNGDVDERPVHVVRLGAYWIDQTEVTNARYAACEAAGGCAAPTRANSITRPNYHFGEEFVNYPVVHVTWDEAAAYCAWAGKRLPTEAEWEYAAKGTDGRRYPWGNDAANPNLLNYDFRVGDTTEVGQYPAAASPFNVLDMAGNVYEWVADWYSNSYYRASPADNPTGPASGVFRVLRGGSWNVNDYAARTADRFRLAPNETFGHIGFRCARSP